MRTVTTIAVAFIVLLSASLSFGQYFDSDGNLNQNLYPDTRSCGYSCAGRPFSDTHDNYGRVKPYSEDNAMEREYQRRREYLRENEASTFGHTFYGRDGKATTCRSTGPNTSVCN